MRKISWKTTDNDQHGFESGWLDDEAFDKLLASLLDDEAVYEIKVMERGGEWHKL